MTTRSPAGLLNATLPPIPSADGENDREPLLSLADLRAADILMVRGSSPLSSFLRSMDQAEYDHIAMIVDVDVASKRVTVADQSFLGFRHFDLGQYEERPEALLVRRHRISGGEDLIVRRMLEYGASSPVYDRYALVTIVEDTVRHLPSLLANKKPKAAAGVISAIADLLSSATPKSAEPAGVCVHPILYAFDVADPQYAGAPYFGLSLSFDERRGLGEWMASWQEFTDRANELPSFDPLRLCDSLLGSLDDVDLAAAKRFAMVSALSDTFAGRHDTRGYGMSDRVLACLALSLLDRLLRQRVVVTPDDIRRTQSLFDVGHFDTHQVEWSHERSATARSERGGR